MFILEILIDIMLFYAILEIGVPTIRETYTDIKESW